MDRIKEKFQEVLTDWILQGSQPFIADYFPTYLGNISYSEDEIEKCKEEVTTNFPLIPEEQRSLYFTDLNKRKLANDMIKDIIFKEVDVPCEVHKKELAKDTDWLRIFCLDWSDTFVRIGLGYYGLSPLVNICKSTYYLYSTGTDWEMVILIMNTFSDISVKSDDITKNTVSGILQFNDVDLNPPQMPEIRMYLTDVSEGKYIPVLWVWDEKECYTEILCNNEGETPANIWVVKSLYQDYTRVVDHDKERLEPGELKTLKIDYEKRPKDGSLVSFYVFSETDSGIYFADYKLKSFSPIHKEILGDISMTTSSGEITADQFENVTVISHPIKATLTRVNMTTYEVIITATNPFAYPINAEITQNTSSWNVSIPPRETKVLNYTIYPELGVETTIPPAYMEYFDFQHNVTVTFASDAINFTATGIAITGYLSYEIRDYVNVNLSITNLVNITNGTFNLTLIGNETFVYNVSANIENVTTHTVEFGPIDVPEGEYIGILTFCWDDNDITVDARNMRKTELPIASFTYTPEHPIVNQNITFNASSSYDPDGEITLYEWDFGDGNITNTTNVTVTHSYALSDNYTVTLTVTDNEEAKNSTSKIIEVKGAGTQVWYFTSEDKPVGAPTANDAQTHAKDNLLHKGSRTGTGEYFSLNYTEVAWFYADTGAACDIGFGERPWEAHVRTEAIEGDEVGHNLTVEICRLDNGTGNVTVLAGHTELLTAVEPQHLWNLTCEDNESTTQDFSTGDWLAVRLSWGCPTDELRIYYKAEAGSDSYLESPTTDPGYPIPEVSTLILLFTGVIALTVLFKKGR